jgi:broad specificity phosphatase PhoE
MATIIYLIRHAEAEGNKHRIFHGSSDSDLTPNGLLQANKAAEALMPLGIEKIYASDLKRAYKTADAFSKMSGIRITVNRSLREIDGGLWENKTWKALEDIFPEEYETWENMPHMHRMPGGESMEELHKRAYDEFEKIAVANSGRTIAVFTHGTFIRVLLCKLTGRPLDQLINVKWHENTAISKIIYDNKRFSIEFEGNYEHLDLSMATVYNQDWIKKQEGKNDIV